MLTPSQPFKVYIPRFHQLPISAAFFFFLLFFVIGNKNDFFFIDDKEKDIYVCTDMCLHMSMSVHVYYLSQAILEAEINLNLVN